jgi:CRISPR-associated protein Cmr2
VNEVILKNQGRTIYAGGDDVLAILPATHALDAATELCDLYKLSFAATKAASSATISGALIYAPFHTSLQELVRSGHQLLDDVAKDRTGRDALAISLVLGSGTNAVWSAPWPVIRGMQPGCPGLKTVLQRFSSQEKDPQGQPAFNSSFLYGLRQQFTKLLDLPINKPGSFGTADFAASADELLTDLAHAEYRRRLNKEQALKFTIEQTRAQLSDLMWLSQRWYRDSEQVRCETQKFSFDGWRVARFLQQVNEGEVGEHG